ncbi:histidine phosphatase family protein [Nocardia harenae]|uniref:histidine phosphatase family protein n=1 Tax=Nocardia harenae TaxID=358707 RepID=UPI0008366C14|nr:histidine phosphatase family protein [Nocardia harenae]
MHLILIRHALPQRTAPGEGIDPPLSPQGSRQSDVLADALRDEKLDAIWTSTMRRAVETAQPMAERYGIVPKRHAGLCEMDWGFNAYVPVEETDHPSVMAFNERLRHQADDRELLEFRAGVAVTMAEVCAAHPADATVAVVAHGGVISAYASTVLGTADTVFFVPGYTGISRFDVAGDGTARLVSLNETGHMKDARADPRPTALERGLHTGSTE